MFLHSDIGICNNSVWSCQGKCGELDYLPCSCQASCHTYQICCEDFEYICNPAEASVKLDSVPAGNDTLGDITFETAKIEFTSKPYCSDLVGVWLEGGCKNPTRNLVYDRCINPNQTLIHDMIPVSDPYTKIHYRNIFCAQCSNSNETMAWITTEECVTETMSAMNISHCLSKVRNPLGRAAIPCIPYTEVSENQTNVRDKNWTGEHVTEYQKKCDAFTSYVMDSETETVYRNRYCLLLDSPHKNSTCVVPPFDNEEKFCAEGKHDDDMGPCMMEVCSGEKSFDDLFCPNETLDLYMKLEFFVGDLSKVKEHLGNIEVGLTDSRSIMSNAIVDDFRTEDGKPLLCRAVQVTNTEGIRVKEWFSKTVMIHFECNVAKTLINDSLTAPNILELLTKIIQSPTHKVKIPLDVKVTACLKRTTQYRKPSVSCSGTTFDVVVKAIRVPLDTNISAEGYISIICCVVSDIGLILRISLQRFVPYFQTTPGKTQFSMCCTLLLAYTFFLIGGIVEIGSTACFVVAVCTHWSFLSSLFWMNVIAFQIWRTFRVWHNHVASKSQRVLIMSSIYAMGIPTLIICFSLGLEILDPMHDFSPAYGKYSCWMNKSYSVLTWFVVPCFSIAAVNGIFAFLTVCSLRVQRTKMVVNTTSKVKPSNEFAVSVRIVILVGVTWLIGLFSVFLDSPVAWMIFTIVNASLGFLISFVLLCNKRVFRLFEDKCFCPARENTATTSISP
ncbi:hypothetical protein SNE40_018544 [Patella caerulea]